MDWKSKRIRAILEGALVEDKAAQDITTSLTVDRKVRAAGTIVAKEPCVVAGLGAIPVLLEIYNELAEKAGLATGRFTVVSHPEVFDGVRVKKGQPIAVVRASAAALLSTERVMLNLLQRMSGVATVTSEFVKAVQGTGVRILDTRRTVPGMRVLDKYAVCCGGGFNRRLDLQSGILIEENHIALGGGVAKTLANALKFRKGGQVVQIVVRTQAELDAAIAGGAESILLDYMTPAATKKAVKQIRAALPGISIEASGKISLEDVKKYAATGVSFIAVQALTSAAAVAELGMKIAVDAS